MEPVSGRQYFLLFGALAFAPLLPWIAAASSEYANNSTWVGIIAYGTIALGAPAIIVGSLVAIGLGAALRVGLAVRPITAALLIFFAGCLGSWGFVDYAISVGDFFYCIPFVISAALVSALVYRLYPQEMVIPSRQLRLTERHALVDGIPFKMPINSEQSPALMAVFSIDAKAAAQLLPGCEVHPLRLWKRALLVVTVIDYRITDIGRYIEYSVASGCAVWRFFQFFLSELVRTYLQRKPRPAP